MAFCRMSTDDWQCDLYCYESCDGPYVTSVAFSRCILKEPISSLAWLSRENLDLIESAAWEPINLPHAGETFYDPDLSSMIQRVENLKTLGYQVPDSALEYMYDTLAGEKQT